MTVAMERRMRMLVGADAGVGEGGVLCRQQGTHSDSHDMTASVSMQKRRKNGELEEAPRDGLSCNQHINKSVSPPLSGCI